MNDESTQTPGSDSDNQSAMGARAHERIDEVADKVKQGASAATDATARTAHRATDRASDAQAYAGDLVDHVCAYVRDKPMQSMAFALAAGWLVGRLMAPRQ